MSANRCLCPACPLCVREAQAECSDRRCHAAKACADRAYADELRKQVRG